MLEQIKHVGMTYVTQRYLWLFAAIVVLSTGPNLAMCAARSRSPADAAHPILFVLGMPLLFSIPFLVGQAKSQFAHARARLTPQFFPAHIAILCGILLTLFVLYPLTLAWLSRFEPLELIALAMAAGVPLVWGTQLNRLTGMLVSLTAIYSLVTTWGQNWWLFQAAEHREVHAAVVAAGVALLSAWLWRLCHLREEQDDYQNMNQMMVARRTGSEAIEQRRIVATQTGRNWLGAWMGDWWHDRLGGYFGGGMVGLVRVLGRGLGAQPAWFQGLIFSAIILSIGVIVNQFANAPGKSGADFGAYFFYAQFAILVPGQMAGEAMAQRRPRIAFEMLLPLRRTQLVDGLLLATARNSVILWLMLNLTIRVVLARTNDQISLETFSVFLLISAAIMFASMAVSLRVSVWPSRAKRVMVLIPSWAVLIAPLIAWFGPHETIGEWPLKICVMFALAGLIAGGTWLIVGARRAWLNLELG